MQIQTKGGILFRGPLCISWFILKEFVYNVTKDYNELAYAIVSTFIYNSILWSSKYIFQI